MKRAALLLLLALPACGPIDFADFPPLVCVEPGLGRCWQEEVYLCVCEGGRCAFRQGGAPADCGCVNKHMVCGLPADGGTQ